MATSDNSSPPPVERVDPLAELRRKRGQGAAVEFVADPLRHASTKTTWDITHTCSALAITAAK